MLQARVTTWPASAAHPNQDAVGVRGDAAVLMDGAGMPRATRAGCRHTVHWFARLATDRYLHRLQDPRTSMADALADTLREVADRHRATCDLEAGGPSATVVAVRRVGDRLEHLVLCDSTLGLVAEDTTTVVTDDRLTEVSHPLDDRLRTLRPGPGEDSRPWLQVLAERDLAVRNRPGGFWCVGHRPEAAEHALTGHTPVDRLRGVVLASDGAMRLAEVFGECTPESLVTAYLQDGADPWLRRTREAERRRSAAALKPHDDATVVIVPLFADAADVQENPVVEDAGS